MKRILFVFDWVGLSAGRTGAGLLRRGLDPGRYEIEALSLHRNPLPVGADIPGVDLDDACHGMDDGGRIAYLAARIAGGGYDAVVAFQGSRSVHPAYRRLCGRPVPPLVEYGNLSRQVFSDLPKSHTARFVAAGRGVLEAAAMMMPPETCRLIDVAGQEDPLQAGAIDKLFDADHRARVPEVWPTGLYQIARDYYDRYRVPLMITETNWAGPVEHRLRRLEFCVGEVRRLRAAGFPMMGFTWYGAYDHLDWGYALRLPSGHIHHVGMWEFERRDGIPARRHTAMVDRYRQMVATGAQGPPAATAFRGAAGTGAAGTGAAGTGAVTRSP